MDQLEKQSQEPTLLTGESEESSTEPCSDTAGSSTTNLPTIASKISKLLSLNLQAEKPPSEWENLEPLADWLEKSVIAGKSRGWIARQLGVPAHIIADLLRQVVDRKKLADLFTARQSMIRAYVLAHGESIAKEVHDLLVSKKLQDRDKLKAAELLLKIMDLKEPDGKALIQVNVTPEAQIIERYEILDRLIGPQAEGGQEPREDNQELGE